MVDGIVTDKRKRVVWLHRS